MKKEFNLSKRIDVWASKLSPNMHSKDVKEFIKRLEKIYTDAQMYADMDDETFWATSTISPQEAQKRADYFYEFLKEVRELAGEKLI